jgi:hypothetical protein
MSHKENKSKEKRMTKPNYKQTLTITLESEDGTESVSISRNEGIDGDDYFW